MLTEAATRFIGADTFSALTGEPAYTSLWERPGEVLHVRLAREADVAVVVPATANVLAKLAHGLADDLLTATLLEATCPLVIAPAMHSGMWEHPATQANVATLLDRGVLSVGPATGPLAHGDEGIGRLAEPEDVVAAVRGALAPQDLAGRTAVDHVRPDPRADRPGPLPREPIDREDGGRARGRGTRPRRGRDRRARARARRCRRASRSCRSQTAEEMRDAVLARFDDADAVVMAAAVADFRPKAIAEEKLKKDCGSSRAPPRADAGHPRGAGGAADGPGARRVRRRDRGSRTGGPEQAGVEAPRSRGGQPRGACRHGLRRGYQRGDAAGRRRERRPAPPLDASESSRPP